MLTEEPAPDPKCKLNISSILTLPNPLCLICAKDIMIIVLLLQMMEDVKVGRGFHLCECLGWGTGDGYHIFSGFCCFSAVVNYSFMTGT